MARTIVVHSWDEALSEIDGAKVTIDGVPGTIKVEHRKRAWGIESKVIHHPSAAGKKTEAYKATKRKLGDDYVTDLTDGERLVEIMTARGFKFISADQWARQARRG